MSSSEKVFLGLGSNIGDSPGILHRAISSLDDRLTEMEVSSIYVTVPQGYEGQNDFLNCVVSGMFGGTPESLFNLTSLIEESEGRVRSFKNAPRTLDIDILLFGTKVRNDQTLTIPHPRIKERKFVLVPLLELDWDLADPATGQKYADCLESLDSQGIYYLDLKRYI